MSESMFQAKLIREIKKRFPEAIVLKNDPKYIDGFPDLTVLYFATYFILEVKKSRDAYLKSLRKQKNQKYYIDKLAKMAHAAFVYPENKEEVLHAMEEAFGARG